MERLTPPNDTDKEGTANFLKSFMMTYQSFTTSEKLLTKLMQRFNVPKSKNMTDAEHASKKLAIQPKVCAVFEAWISGYFSQLNPKFVQRLAEFIENQVSKEPNLKVTAKVLLDLIEKKKLGEDKTTTKEPSDPKVPDNIFSQNLFILDIGEEEIARQLTLIEFDVFKDISSSELLNQAWNKPKLRYRSPNVLKMIDNFNNISLWMSSLILMKETSRERAAQIKKIVKIAEVNRPPLKIGKGEAPLKFPRIVPNKHPPPPPPPRSF